ncbi:MAG: hypothetical protein H6807_08800 [Planctomycetes bacterium]|nr:hypothetical protein [Planctomycetota bacterium]
MTTQAEHRNPWTGRIALAICALFVIGVFWRLSLTGNLLDHGDIHTDQRAIVAADEFRELGFQTLHFMQTEDSVAEFGFEPSYYHRHPAGGVMALAILQEIGLERATIRLLPLLATAIGLYGFFRFQETVAGNAIFALVGTGMLAVAAPYYILADSFQLYSYGLMAKGLCFWFVAAAATRDWRPRLKLLFLSFLTSFLSVTLFGLETMPAVGLASFFAPLVLAGPGIRRRLAAAVASASLTGLGMALGWAVRIANMMTAFDGDLSRTLRNLAGSLSSRSVGREFDLNSAGRAYAAEVWFRVTSYLPVHLILGAAGLLVATVVIIRFGRDRSRPALLAVIICLVSELPYFIVMRRHVYLHPHTTVHLTLSAAALGGLLWAYLPARNRLLTALGGAAGVAAFGLVLVLSPRTTWGNLVLPVDGRHVVAIRNEVDQLLSGLPEHSLVLVGTTHGYSWHVRCFGSMRGLRCVDMAPDGERIFITRDPDSGRQIRHGLDAFDHRTFANRPEVGNRPVYLVVETHDQDSLAAATGRFECLRSGARMALFGVARYPALPLSASVQVSVSSLRDFVQVSPTEEEMAAAKVNYRLANKHRNGLWLHAPPRAIGKPTVAAVTIPIAKQITRITGVLDYDRAEKPGQPKLSFSLRARDGGALVGEGGMAVTPGETGATFAIDLAPNTAVDALEFGLELAEGETHNSWAGVVVRDLELRR